MNINKQLLLLPFLLLANTLLFAQSPLKLNIYAGVNTNEIGSQANFFDNVTNTQLDYVNIMDKYQKLTPNVGLGIDYAFNEWQSFRTGLLFLWQKYELYAYGPGQRTEYITHTRTLAQMRLPLLYNHQVMDIKRYRTKIKLNVGTSLNFNIMPGQSLVSSTFTGADTFQLKETRFKAAEINDLPLILGLEFQFYNKEGKDGLYISATRNFDYSKLISHFSYSTGGITNTYETYMGGQSWLFNIGYLLPLKK